MADYRENVVTTILPLCLNSHQSSEILCHVLPSLSEHGIFSLKRPDTLQHLVGDINNDLNSHKKRLEGILLLEHLLSQCSPQVFTINCQTWIQLLVQTLQSHGSVMQHQCALRVLSVMIERVTAFPELARDVGTTKMKGLLTALLSLFSRSVAKEAVVSCIISCILHFPGPTMTFKDSISKALTTELDTVAPSEVYMRCFALLARCTTGGHRGDKFRECWTAQYSILLSTLKDILSQLYVGLESGEEVGEDMLFVNSIPNTQPEQTVCLVRRFATVSACLAALLREPFPTWVPLPVEEILSFVRRTLVVQLDMLTSKSSMDSVLLMTHLPLLHSAALSLLSQLIMCGKSLLIPDVEEIHWLCLHCLTSTRSSVRGSASGFRAFRKLREQVYCVLSTWLRVVGPSGGRFSPAGGGNMEDLLSEIFFDIAMQKQESLELSSDGKNSKRSLNSVTSKKRKKKLKASSYLELSTNSLNFYIQGDIDTAFAALTLFRLLVTSTTHTMPDIIFSHLQQKLLQLMEDMLRGPLPPYSVSSQCRQLLYQSLLAAVCAPKHEPLLLRKSIQIFQLGMLDSDFMVTDTCRESLFKVQSLIHPTVPCLLAPAVKKLASSDPATEDIAEAEYPSLVLENVKDSQSTKEGSSTVNVAVRTEAVSKLFDPETVDTITLRQNVNSEISKSLEPSSGKEDKEESDMSNSDSDREKTPAFADEQGEGSQTIASARKKLRAAPAKRKFEVMDSEASSSSGTEEDEAKEKNAPRKEDVGVKAVEVQMSHGCEATPGARVQADSEEVAAELSENNASLNAMMLTFNPCEADSDVAMSD